MSINPFKKKPKTTDNLQELNQQFNETVYKIGAAQYRKALVSKQLGDISNELAALQKEGEAMALRIQSIQGRIQAEMKAKIAEGTKNETPNNDVEKLSTP